MAHVSIECCYKSHTKLKENSREEERKRLRVDTGSTSFAKNRLARSSIKSCRHWSRTYQRVINGEAKSCRGRAKSLSHGYNPVNFGTGPTPCPMASKKIPCSLFCTRSRRDVFAGINCCFGVCLRPNRASQWASAEILPQQREKLHNHHSFNAAGSCNIESDGETDVAESHSRFVTFDDEINYKLRIGNVNCLLEFVFLKNIKSGFVFVFLTFLYWGWKCN